MSNNDLKNQILKNIKKILTTYTTLTSLTPECTTTTNIFYFLYKNMNNGSDTTIDLHAYKRQWKFKILIHILSMHPQDHIHVFDKNFKFQNTLEFYLKVKNQDRIWSFLASHA